jgi:hypothetical protein
MATLRARALLTAASIFAGCGVAQAADDTSLIVYGIAWADFITDSGRVDPDWQDAFRPSKIATFDGQFGEDGQTSISVKQSTFGIKGALPVGNDLGPITFKFEFDLFGTGEDAGQTTFRLRHVFAEWGPLLAGQTTSVFQDGDFWPNIVDYWGPNGMVFYRNVQIRYTPWQTDHMKIAFAVERPGNDVDAGQIREFDPELGDNITAAEEWPDFTAQFRWWDSWGHLQISGILRSIGFETQGTPNNDPHGDETGWGFNISSHFNVFERDKIFASVVFGEGIASYMNDGGTDLAPGGTILNPHAEAVPMLGAAIYYDLWWNEHWSTSFGYSFNQVDNTSLQAADAYHKGQYASLNLLWQPAPQIVIGGEAMWGDRENNDGTRGEDYRFQFTVRYNFSIDVFG